jgi:hypothetical protein
MVAAAPVQERNYERRGKSRRAEHQWRDRRWGPRLCNMYIGVNNPLQEDADGNMLSRGNVFMGTSGSTTSKGSGFTPPYALTVDATTALEATIKSQAGPH